MGSRRLCCRRYGRLDAGEPISHFSREQVRERKPTIWLALVQRRRWLVYEDVSHAISSPLSSCSFKPNDKSKPEQRDPESLVEDLLRLTFTLRTLPRVPIDATTRV